MRLKVEFLIFIKNDGNGLTPLEVEPYFFRCRSLPRREKCRRISAVPTPRSGEVWKLWNCGNFAFECREVVLCDYIFLYHTCIAWCRLEFNLYGGYLKAGDYLLLTRIIQKCVDKMCDCTYYSFEDTKFGNRGSPVFKARSARRQFLFSFQFDLSGREYICFVCMGYFHIRI